MVTIAGGIVLAVFALIAIMAVLAIATHIILNAIAEFLAHPVLYGIALGSFLALAGGIIWAIAQ